MKVQSCDRCDNCRWACENHNNQPWLGARVCGCERAGVPCSICNAADVANWAHRWFQTRPLSIRQSPGGAASTVFATFSRRNTERSEFACEFNSKRTQSDQGKKFHQRVYSIHPVKPRWALPSGVSFWHAMAWFKRFYDPIILPDGRELRTYRDAAEYISALPKAEQDAADWLIAMETLLLVAERNAPEMLARIAIVKALDRHVKPT